jgi:hypothetical protein
MADRHGTRLTDDNSIPTLAQPRLIADGKPRGRMQADGRVLHIGKMVQKRHVWIVDMVRVEMRCACGWGNRR